MDTFAAEYLRTYWIDKLKKNHFSELSPQRKNKFSDGAETFANI